MKTYIIILLNFLILLSLGCHVKVKNRIRIIGGHYRLVSYKMTDSGLLWIYPATSLDTVLGLGISLDIELYSDGSEHAPLIHFETPGYKGVEDSLENIVITSPEEEIQQWMSNDSLKATFVINRDHRIGDGAVRYVYRDFEGNSFRTNYFNNWSDFKEKYNQRAPFVNFFQDITLEFFFWVDPIHQNSIREIDKTTFKIKFLNGREVTLYPLKGDNSTPPVELDW